MAWGRRAEPRRFWVEEVVPGALARRRWRRWRMRTSAVFGAVQAASGWAAHVAAVAGLAGLLALLVRPLGGRGIFPPRTVLQDVGLVLTALGVASFVLLFGLYALTGRLKRWLDSSEPLSAGVRRLARALLKGLLVELPLAVVAAVLWSIVGFVYLLANLPSLIGRAVLAPVLGWLPWLGRDDA
ncbi:hypothetical protein U7230_09445 [Carboxydochorda subterranea]|uniref:Uncharacterized protein n=1 Tax=Carboxydichorda subterranea TaxID=3109565 RepID=A0ABZ1BU29_9FIRM|nr:hypothetical protein [Limnochorda sp. L945t]WRP16322.1 hypothetical protein U7230_09445 [Limnochorda sp. L945t]